MARDFLNDISSKEEVKKEGDSPFAKKRKVSNKVVRISKENYEKIRVQAFNKHETIFEELSSLIEDGYKYRDEHENK